MRGSLSSDVPVVDSVSLAGELPASRNVLTKDSFDMKYGGNLAILSGRSSIPSMFPLWNSMGSSSTFSCEYILSSALISVLIQGVNKAEDVLRNVPLSEIWVHTLSSVRPPRAVCWGAIMLQPTILPSQLNVMFGKSRSWRYSKVRAVLCNIKWPTFSGSTATHSSLQTESICTCVHAHDVQVQVTF